MSNRCAVLTQFLDNYNNYMRLFSSSNSYKNFVRSFRISVMSLRLPGVVLDMEFYFCISSLCKKRKQVTTTVLNVISRVPISSHMSIRFK